MSAVESMIQYLCDTSVAPLQRELVEVPEPYCSMVPYHVLCVHVVRLLYLVYTYTCQLGEISDV